MLHQRGSHTAAAGSCHHSHVRAIPEMNLEHRSSMYLARTFPKCQPRWPAVDEDIAVLSLSSRPRLSWGDGE